MNPVFFVIVLLVTVPVMCQDDFWFTIQPQQNIPVVSGESITLQCNVSNTKHITFEWTLRDEIVKNTTRRFQEGSHLRITRIDPAEDSGEFNCIATNISTGLSLRSLGYSLSIKWLEEVAKVELQSPKSADKIVKGATVILKCSAEGSSDLRVEWFKNGARMFRDSSITLKNKRIYLNQVSKVDNGLYTCKASNGAGSFESRNKFAMVIQGTDGPKITRIPKDVITQKDGKARFDCSFDGDSVTEWYFRDSGPLTNTSRLVVYSNGTLMINKVRGSDKGLYNCRGISKNSRTDNPPNYAVRLTLAYLEDFPKQPFKPKKYDKLNVVPQDSAFEVKCKYPDGIPKPKVWWENPAGRVISSSGHIRVEDGRLVIDGAKKADSGKYRCVAENVIGQKHRSLQLQVTVPPKITADPSGVPVIDEDKTTSLMCNYVASPFPLTEVLWLKDDKYLDEIGGHFVAHTENGTLEIHEATVSDKGSYKCEVRTKGFKPVQSKGVEIIIKEKLKFVPIPVDKKLELGSTSKIYCKARGSSKPVVKWVKKMNGEIMFDWPQHITDKEGTLYFKGIQVTDAGKYMCIATNSQGLINATIKVDVIVFPRFVIKPKNTSAYEGESVMIHCTAFSDPVPTIQWDKNSVMNGFDQNRSTVFKNGTLLIKDLNLNDQGRYGCTAGNIGGLKREEIILFVTAKRNPNSGTYRKDSFMAKTVIITMSVATSYMLLVIGLMVWCRCRRAKRKATLVAEVDVEGEANNEAVALNTESNQKSKNGIAHHCKGDKHELENPSQQSNGSHSSRRSHSSYDQISFPRHDIDMNKRINLGNGNFGSVILARAIGIIEGETDSAVMIKSLEHRDEEIQFEFKREIDMFHKSNHENVVKLLGICREAEPALMILEYVDVGDLKQFLLAMRKGTQRKGHRSSSLSHLQVMSICNQVAMGMEHISNQRFIHKDLAARNCLINSSFKVKITIQKLSHDTYKSEYVTYRNQLLPARWIAPEAFTEDEYSTKSDIWSFAVLAWEVLHQGQMPFHEHPDEEIVNLLEQKLLKWSISEKTTPGLSNLLIQCWSDSPKYRPSFSEIVIQLGDILANSDI